MAKRSIKYFPFDKSEGPVLVVGSKIYEGRQDWRKTYPDGVGLDMLPGDGVDIVHDLETETPENLRGHFGHIDCVSILEHSKRPWLAAQSLQEMLRPGGSIYLSVPFVWRYHPYPDDYWRFTHAALPILFQQVEWQTVGYVSGDEFLEVPHKKYAIKDGEKALLKTEVVAFGVRSCESFSTLK
jgi:hypothetical protein